MPKGFYVRRTTHENFLRKVDKVDGGCWEWTGAVLKDGYGHFHVNRKGVIASRYSYQHYKGDIPPGLVVRHKCDNPKCVNPEHLELGTQKDNYNDAKMKGRHVHGEKHGNVLYSGEQIKKVLQLIAEGMRPIDISKQTGVALSTVYDVRLGRSWKHLK